MTKLFRRLCLGGALTLSLGSSGLATVAFADPSTPPAPAEDFGLTGDWGGLRTRLASDGLTFSAGYTAELAYNARGGD